jgi:dienelactone hydrolase
MTLPWVNRPQTPPQALPPDAPALASFPTDDWEQTRERLRTEWLDVLGAFPPRPSVAIETLSRESLDGIVREHVRYETEPGFPVEAYLCRPERDGRFPGVVVFHSTSRNSILQPAGLADAREHHIGLNLARRGFVTLSPRCFLWDKNVVEDLRGSIQRVLAVLNERHPGWTGIGKMTWDGMIALDILAARDDVDAERLGCAGHSLGAKEALYLAAFDERVKASVSSEGGIGVRFSNWHDAWYLGEQVNAPGWTREHHELVALIAPRPFLLLGGDSADGDRSLPSIASVRPLYERLGAPDAVAFLNHRKGHAIPPLAETALYEWMREHLRHGEPWLQRG